MSIKHSPKCGAKAKSRDGKPCLHVALANGRCYYHGGRCTGPRTIAGKQKCKEVNIRHGYYSKEAMEERKAFRETLKEFKDDIYGT